MTLLSNRRLRIQVLFLLLTCILMGDDVTNPFFLPYETPFGMPPFDKIQDDHFVPAMERGMEEQLEEIASIVRHRALPTFENTILPLEYSGALLDRVTNVFFNLAGADTNERREQISAEMAPKLAAHRSKIALNEELFARIDALYSQRDNLNLSEEEMALLSKHYRRFVRNGAKLQGAAKERLAAIDQELSSLSVRFGQNVLAETNQYVLILRDPAELEGLTEEQVASAADAAKQRGLEKAWVFTVHKPSMIPFLQNSTHRHLRQQLFTAYVERGNRANEYDNNAIAAKMAALRAERAKLLGFESHAHYQLSENMAKTPEEVYGLLHQLWKPALAKAKEEASLLTAMLKADHPTADLQPWDWWYYAEKVKKRDYDLNENDLKPYFSLDMVRQGAFDVATQLFGIRFKERTDLPVYHPEVQVFEVLEANGDHIGLLTTDYFPRASKRGGAWMNALRKQMKKEGKMITPIISNVGNFSRPVGDQPALLTFEEVLTLFHEFGHALHGLLSKGTYPTFTGTSVARDFVELPSQIMENWAAHPDVIRTYAKHWKTGEVIPDALLTKMDKAGKFNQGFATTEYLAACFLDMDWHTLTDTTPQQVATFEKASMAKIGLIPEIVVRYRTPYFGHIFAGGYSSGYYGYVWAEVLDADAFEAFRQKGLFDPTLATAFREHILSAGGVREAMDAYQAFRGQKPTIEPLLKKRGLN